MKKFIEMVQMVLSDLYPYGIKAVGMSMIIIFTMLTFGFGLGVIKKIAKEPNERTSIENRR